MNIAIAGAGPVGLYAAGLLKHLYPDSPVHVFEKRSADQLTGFGYTVHSDSLRLLGILHPDVATAIAQKGTAPSTRRTIAFRGREVDLDPEVCRQMPIIGVEYDSLISVLKARAAAVGVELHYEAAVADLDALAANHDLVIVANGANSAFVERFDPMRVHTALSYAWGKKQVVSDQMAMGLDTLGTIPYICHQYPVSHAATALIVEVREEDEAEAAEELARSPDLAPFFPEGAIFRKIPLCLCRKRVHRNVVCIGDAALAQYFAAGAGLYFGLMQTGLLFHQLDTAPGSIEQKLKAYDAQAREFFRFQWQPNKSLIRKKLGLLNGHADMTDEAVMNAMVADE